MQIFYILSFLMIIFMSVHSLVKETSERPEVASDVWAVHMGSWHKAATITCQETQCVDGEVPSNDIRGHLPEVVVDSPAFENARYTTNYDEGSGYLVTYMQTGRPPEVTQATLAGAYGRLLKGKHSTYFGIWDIAQSQIFFPNGANLLKTMTPPASAMIGVPDKSPVIVSRL